MNASERRIKTLINLGIVAAVLLIVLLIREFAGGLVAQFCTAFMAILLPFSIALFISYLIAPVFKLLERHLKFKFRLINTIIVFIGVGFLLVLFGRFAGTLIYTQGVAFIENDWPRVVSYFDDVFSEDSSLRALYAWLTEYVQIGEGEKITIDLISIFQSLTTIVITIVLVPVFLFFILNDKDRIYESLIGLVPKRYRDDAIELSTRANKVVTEYFNGRFITMFVMAIFFTLLLLVLGFRERAILFGFMLGFFDIVPYVGPFIAIILPVLWSLTETSQLPFGELSPYIILIAVVLGQMIQNNIAQPLIMGRETKIHPLLVLSAFIFFAYVFGIVGLILAIPITGMIKSTVNYYHEKHAHRLALNEAQRKKIREDTT